MDYCDEIRARMAARVYRQELPQHSDPARSNFVRAADECTNLNLTVVFERGCEGSEVLLGHNLRGALTVRVFGRGSRVHVGDDCGLWGLSIISRGARDTVIVGDKVTVVGSTTIVAQQDAPLEAATVVVGDDCMFSTGIVVRNGDGHPVIDPATRQQVNAATRPVVIEPHVWVGQDAAILKNTHIGAGSIVAQGAVVTKSMPRYSRAAGVPAVVTPIGGPVWARDMQPHHVDAALACLADYPPAGVTDPPTPGRQAVRPGRRWWSSRPRRR